MQEEQRGFLVRGRVQGVGFRWWTTERARSLGLAGWVRNRPDGAVEVHARGEEEALDELAQALSHGPGPARVTAVEEIASTESLDGAGFGVRR